MSNNLKEVIANNFNKDRNYNVILSKVEGVGNMKKIKIKFALIPICALAIVIIGINQISLFNKKNPENSWSVKKVYRSPNSITDAISKTQLWEEKNISQQFNEFDYNDIKYVSRTTKISSNKIGEKLDTATFTGYDSYKDMFHKSSGDIYSVKDLSQECVLAVKFENDNNYYVYVNSKYNPENLEQLIIDLKLDETLSFGSIWYKYSYNDKKNISQIEIIEFPDVSDDIIWKLLFNDTTSQNINDENSTHNTIMDIDIDISILGYENATVSISEDGFLITNILDTSKAFYIGEEKVKEFVNYVIENCKGYKIEYVYDENDIEDSTHDDTILMYDKSTDTTTNVIINSTPNKDASSAGYNPQKD